VLVGLAVWRRRAPNPDPPQPVPPLPGLWLGTLVLTAVGIVIAGWFALLVPALALLAYRRHALLVPIAFAALAGAGIAAATGAGEPVGAGHGAFGHAAQLLALIGLFAGVVSVHEPDEGPGATAILPPTTAPGPAPHPAPGPAPHPSPGPAPGSEAPTRPLPPMPPKPDLPDLPQRRPGESGPPAEAGTRVPASPRPRPGTQAPAPRPDAGPTVSARGPGGPDPEPPTARIPLRKPQFRPTPPETQARPETDRGRDEST
jgi:arabinofuranan 3-O-arabinosyltransferase